MRGKKALIFYPVGASRQSFVLGRYQGPGSGLWLLGLVPSRQAGLWMPWGAGTPVAVKGSLHGCQLLQEGRPLPGLQTGLSSNARNEVVRGDVLTRQRLYWKMGTWWEGTVGPRRAACCTAAVLGFTLLGFVSGLSLTSHSDSGSFLGAHMLLSQDGCQQEGFWEVLRHVGSPFYLFWTLPIGGGLLVPCSFLGSPVIK